MISELGVILEKEFLARAPLHIRMMFVLSEDRKRLHYFAFSCLAFFRAARSSSALNAGGKPK
jgi:hypothetical protein